MTASPTSKASTPSAQQSQQSPAEHSTATQILRTIAQTDSTIETIADQLAEWTPDQVKAALELATSTITTTVASPTLDQEQTGLDTPSEIDLNKILVVDDQPLNCRLIQQIMKHSEFSLSYATNGQEGLEMARAERPFLVLSDIMMPIMDGFELCEKLKADPRTKDAAVIFVTAHHRDADMVTRGLDMGADDYIYRPFQPSELEARVRAVARLKRTEVEARQRAETVIRQNKELELLNEMALAATSAASLQGIFAPSAPRLCQLVDADAVALVLLDERSELSINVITREGESISVPVDFPTSHVTPQSLQMQAPHLLSAILSMSGDKSAPIPNIAASSIQIVPMVSRERTIGAMAIIQQSNRPLSDANVMLLNSATGIMTVADENARLFREVEAFTQELERMVERRTLQLVAEKEKIEAILASMADGLLVLDGENRILTANRMAEKMLAFDLDETRGKAIEEAQLHSPLWQCVYEMAAGTNPTQSAAVDVPDVTYPDGVLSIQARSAKMRGDGREATGKTTGTVVVLRDISALKEVERAKARFMAGITHELKTPLAVIEVHTNNLLTYYERLPKDQQKEMLGTIQKQVGLLARSVEDILDLARLDAGAVEIEVQEINLTHLVEEIVTNIRPLADSKQIAFEWNAPPGKVMAVVDPDLISRATSNLVDNAIKYTPEGGQVGVTIAPIDLDRQPVVEIRVRDTGIGIAQEHQEHIFERFYRVDPSHTIPGAGLGLAIVKEIIDLHGGDVRLESVSGEGSTFIITVPMTSYHQ